jgi:hypothetical protein
MGLGLLYLFMQYMLFTYAVYPSGLKLPQDDHIMWPKYEGAENIIFWAKNWKWGTLFFVCLRVFSLPPQSR